MKSVRILFCVFFLAAFSAPAQETQQEALAVNIEIAVRVFQGRDFIDNLILQDFEVYEDGALQDIAAVYLIRNTDISREEKSETAPVTLDQPQTQRHFVMAFEVINWLPRIRDSLEYFFDFVLQKEDSLIITTPLKTYRLTQAALERTPRSQLLDELTGLLRRDIIDGNREFKNMIQDMKSFNTIEEGTFPSAQTQRALFERIQNYQYFDEKKFQAFAEHLKDLQGQKNVFFFYQKEEIPKPRYGTDLDLYARDNVFDVDRIKRLFSDNTITTYFLFITKELEGKSDVTIFNPDYDRPPLTDQSYAIFKPFHEVTKTSGGITTASADPFPAFQSTAEATRNYYLLYYSPKKYKADGGFRNIEVRVKSGKYRIYHRAGYLAD